MENAIERKREISLTPLTRYENEWEFTNAAVSRENRPKTKSPGFTDADENSQQRPVL
ncbi:hypothetical protein [Dechloromonas denitrificans]|uniref:hypothetical protein n=1 Tax=Dechloromonas denitrificans TaxID=281362 RepID=UPI001CF97655|nr:hypothetical protein [Dechloromonas denitrificans]UCV07644.1 hypothetical protein KI615_20040 [Dechloromonas denitrificans]